MFPIGRSAPAAGGLQHRPVSLTAQRRESGVHMPARQVWASLLGVQMLSLPVSSRAHPPVWVCVMTASCDEAPVSHTA